MPLKSVHIGGLSRRTEAPMKLRRVGGSNSGRCCPTAQGLRSGLSRRPALWAILAGMVGLAVPRLALAAHEVRPWPANRAAPGLELTDLDGKTWSLASLKGQAVVLNFWASWCEPCRAEMPSLELLAKKYERDGLTVLAVNYQEAIPIIQRFLAAMPFSLPILLDRDGQAARSWTPRVFPSTVLIDRAGRPRNVVLGELDWMSDAALELVKPLLARNLTAQTGNAVYADNSPGRWP